MSRDDDSVQPPLPRTCTPKDVPQMDHSTTILDHTEETVVAGPLYRTAHFTTPPGRAPGSKQQQLSSPGRPSDQVKPRNCSAMETVKKSKSVSSEGNGTCCPILVGVLRAAFCAAVCVAYAGLPHCFAEVKKTDANSQCIKAAPLFGANQSWSTWILATRLLNRQWSWIILT